MFHVKAARHTKFINDDLARKFFSLVMRRLKMQADINNLQEEVNEEFFISVGTNKPGQSFGHLALAYNPLNPNRVEKRQATIKTIKPCVFAIMHKKNYR